MNHGTNMKTIRKNRGFSQKEISKEIISQGTFSKFETELLEINTDVFLNLLNRLDISFEEFEYIRNDFSFGEKQNIIHKFFKLNYNNIEKLNELKIQIDKFLTVKEDLCVSEIQLICIAFLQLNQTKDINIAKNIIIPIWNRISKYDQWYLNDIRLINTILFLFPVNSVIEFTRNVLDRLNKYTDFRDAELLKSALLINLSLLLIKNKDYTNALVIIEESLEQLNKMNYLILSLHFSRCAICRYHLGYNDSSVFLDKAYQLLSLYNDGEYWKIINNEFNYYTQ